MATEFHPTLTISYQINSLKIEILAQTLPWPLCKTLGKALSSVAQSCMTLCDPMNSTLCPSPTPGVHPNSCPLSQWCHPTISSSIIPFSYPQFFPSIRVFSNESVLCIRWPKYWEFQLQYQFFQWIFRTDFLWDCSVLFEHWTLNIELVCSPCSPRDSQESSPTPQFKSIKSLVLSFLYSPTLTSILDYWKNHSFDYMDLCWPSEISAFLVHYLGLSSLYFQGTSVF